MKRGCILSVSASVKSRHLPLSNAILIKQPSKLSFACQLVSPTLGDQADVINDPPTLAVRDAIDAIESEEVQIPDPEDPQTMLDGMDISLRVQSETWLDPGVSADDEEGDEVTVSVTFCSSHCT